MMEVTRRMTRGLSRLSEETTGPNLGANTAKTTDQTAKQVNRKSVASIRGESQETHASGNDLQVS